MDQIAAKAKQEEFSLDFYTNRGVNMLTYGQAILIKAVKQPRCRPLIYLSPFDQRLLRIFDRDSNKLYCIDLTEIVSVDDEAYLIKQEQEQQQQQNEEQQNQEKMLDYQPLMTDKQNSSESLLVKTKTFSQILETELMKEYRKLAQLARQATGRVIIKNTKGSVIKLFFDTYLDKKSVYQGLLYLKEQAIKEQQRLDSIDSTYSMIKKIFLTIDEESSYSLTIDEFRIIVNELQINLPEKRLQAFFNKHQIQGKISQELFQQIIDKFEKKEEVKQIFLNYSNLKNMRLGVDQFITPCMTREQLAVFFQKEQKQNLTEEDLVKYEKQERKRIKQFHQIENSEGFSMKFFQNLLFNDQNSIFDPIFNQQHHSEDHPLPHYFISSSHNTYLLANQLTGEASLDAYIQAFQEGFKCVELDCWDGENQPIVTHGHTLTSTLDFEEVIKVVKQFGFIQSDYPVILSLENHCGYFQQGIMAEMLETILGDSLFVVQDFLKPSFPKLSELKGKILVKNKCSNSQFAKTQIESSTQEKDYFGQKDKAAKTQYSEQFSTASEFDKNFKDKTMYKKAKYNERLQAITSLYGVKLDTKRYRFDHVWSICSFDEDQIKQHLDKKEFQAFLQEFFIRTYPLGTRIDSSNYDPTPFWNVGAQIVALNAQTKDLPLLLNQAKFSENGSTGYVLKPYWMRCGGDFLQYKNKVRVIKIRVISGQHFIWEDQSKMKELVDPYVKVRLKGMKSDEAKGKKWKTSTADQNGNNPTFNYECKIELQYPELALIYFQVYHYSLLGDTLLAQYALPANCMRQGLLILQQYNKIGYRVVPLVNTKLQKIQNSFIFIHVEIQGKE